MDSPSFFKLKVSLICSDILPLVNTHTAIADFLIGFDIQPSKWHQCL